MKTNYLSNSLIYKWLLGLIVIFNVSSTYACTGVSEITWPDEALYYYFKTVGTKIIPFPSEICDFKDEIRFKNIQGQFIGSFKVLSSSRHKYDHLRANYKRSPEIIKLYQKSLSQSLDPISFTDILLRFMNSSLSKEYNKPLQFVSGRYTGTPLDLVWNPYQQSTTHWNATSIDYEMLLSLYLKPDVEFVMFDSDEVFSFPKANIPQKKYSNFVKFELPEITNLNNLKSAVDDKDIVVFSSHKKSIQAYNYITESAFNNKKKIYWFKDANLKWIQFDIKNKFTETIDQLIRISNFTEITIPDFLDFIDFIKPHTLVDIRDDEHFNSIRFKDTKKSSFDFFEPKELKKYYLKHYTAKDFENKEEDRKKYGDYVLLGLNLIKKQHPVILVGNHKLDIDKTRIIHNRLYARGYKQILTLLKPIDEVYLYLKEKGLNPKDYIIEDVPRFKTIPEF